MKRKVSDKSVPSPFFRTNEALIDELYYEAMELLEGTAGDILEALALLLRARELDEHAVHTHIGLVHAYGALGDKEAAHAHIQRAYQETLKLFPRWPKRLEWGFLENRAYLRALQYRADLYADEGEKEKAIELYRLLLKLNPNDNQGVRYTISGVYAGITGKDVNALMDEGNEKQNWDKLQNLVKEQNAKHKFWNESD